MFKVIKYSFATKSAVFLDLALKVIAETKLPMLMKRKTLSLWAPTTNKRDPSVNEELNLKSIIDWL